MIVREIGRIVVALVLLIIAGFLFYFGFKFPEPAQALGAGATAGTIIGAEIVYWLKPS